MEATAVGGFPVISEICKAIDSNDILIANLTGLNENVLFEVGYSIGRNKRVWLILNPKSSSRSFFQRFQLLSTLGYCPYDNSAQVVQAFYREAPFNDLQNTPYRTAIESLIRPPEPGKPKKGGFASDRL
jgi:hypothetical protein